MVMMEAGVGLMSGTANSIRKKYDDKKYFVFEVTQKTRIMTECALYGLYSLSKRGLL